MLYAMRSFLAEGKDPNPAVENIKNNLKIYPYEPGSYGTSIAEALEGKVRLGGEPKIPETKFTEISGKSFNTIPPSDYGFFEMINENVQEELATTSASSRRAQWRCQRPPRQRGSSSSAHPA